MRHGHSYRKLGRESAHRRAMLRNMATSFFENEGKIETTLPRAKELKPIVESLITSGKKGTLHDRRRVASYLFGKDATKVVFERFGKEFSDRPGGYTRLLKVGNRKGDGAEMAHLQVLGFKFKEKVVPEQKAEAAAEGSESSEK